MKLNITLGQPPINGYLNIDPNLDHDGKVVCPLDNLNDHVDDAECEEILALDVLEYIPKELADKTVVHWLSKLAHGGKIILSGINARQVAKAILNKSIDIDAANILMYGEQNHPWQRKYGITDIQRLSDVLTGLGLKVISKQLDGFKMTVIAERP